MADSSALELKEITKRFGDFVALQDVSLRVPRGRITALLGENGAGKTTLMRSAFGAIQPDKGSIEINGRSTQLRSPSDAIAAGIGMVHQQFSLIPAMTVAENVALGGKGRYSFDQIAARLSDVAARTGLSIDPRARVAELGSAERQRLEIIRTFAHDASVLILDEPTAVLTARDTEELFKQLKGFAASGGAVVLITHKLADALEHADDVTVLRRGQVVLTAVMDDVTKPGLAAAMIGKVAESSAREDAVSKVKAEAVANLTDAMIPGRRPIEHVSIAICGGEIVGVAALNNAAGPLLRVLSGRQPITSGTLRIPDEVAFIPENRNEEALIGDFDLSENLALGGASRRKGVIDWNAISHRAAEVISLFDVRTSGVSASPRELSGGNQQRFVLGRELSNNPALLILENPTQGLDVRAAGFVHDRIRKARDEGSAVVFYSSDLDELAEIADRVLVVSPQGMTSVAADKQSIGNALLGIQRADAG